MPALKRAANEQFQKTREDVKLDMAELYHQLKAGEVDLRTANELANITGKWLKADALDWAERQFMARLGRANG